MKQVTEQTTREEEEARTAGRLKLRELLQQAVRRRAVPRHIPKLSNPLLLEWLKGCQLRLLDYEYLKDVPSDVLADLNAKIMAFYGIPEYPGAA